MLAPARPSLRSEVPVLDLSGLASEQGRDALAAMLRKACTTTGFFYVANHGVPRSVVSGMFEASDRYFSLPLDQRMSHLVDERFRRGFMPVGRIKHPGYTADLKESFNFGLNLGLDDPDVAAGRPLHGPNRWPADCPWLREAAEAYFEGATGVARRVMQLMARSLGQSDGFFDGCYRKPMLQTWLFHYAPHPPDAGEKVLGAAPHTDYGMLTILAQDPVGGLELQKRDGEWIAAPYIEDTFVCNIGDMMAVWTNDLYRSNLHRVINRSGGERYSIPTFYNPDYDAPVSCLAGCSGPGNPPKYEPITAGEYLIGRFRTTMNYKPPAELAEQESA